MSTEISMPTCIVLVRVAVNHLHTCIQGSTVRVMFFDFSSAFNTIQPSLLRGKLEGAGVDCHLAARTTDYLTNRPQCVRLCDCVSDVEVCGTGAPQGRVLSPFLFTLYTANLSYNTDSCHLQKFSDDTAIVARVAEGNDLEYRKVITYFVAWCELNHLRINASKTKEVVIDCRRKAAQTAPVNIHSLDTEIMQEYKHVGVHINNKLDWTRNTDAMYKSLLCWGDWGPLVRAGHC